MLACGAETPPAESPSPGTGSPDVAALEPGGGRDGYLEASDGARLYYEVVGSGPQWVLVPHHFFLRDALAAEPGLMSGRTTVFYDLRNRGRSEAVDDLFKLSILQDVVDLESVRRHFGAERVSLIGFSYLGKMVAMYAMEHPDRVERLIQLGPTSRDATKIYPSHLSATDRLEAMGVESVRALQLLRVEGAHLSDPRGFCQREWEVTRRALVGDPDNAARIPDPCAFEREWPVNLSRHFESLLVANQSVSPAVEELARIAAPVLTIHGTRDRHAAYGGGRDWAYELPRARLLTVEGAAHCAWVDDPKAVFTAMARFLDGEWPDGAEDVERPDPRVDPDDEV